MINHIPISDITMTDEFMRDYDRAPEYVKGRINRLSEMMMVLEHFPTSMNVRPTYFADGLVMGNVTQRRQAYRVLFWIDQETGLVTLHRLLSHDERDKYVRPQRQ